MKKKTIDQQTLWVSKQINQYVLLVLHHQLQEQ